MCHKGTTGCRAPEGKLHVLCRLPAASRRAAGQAMPGHFEIEDGETDNLTVENCSERHSDSVSPCFWRQKETTSNQHLSEVKHLVYWFYVFLCDPKNRGLSSEVLHSEKKTHHLTRLEIVAIFAVTAVTNYQLETITNDFWEVVFCSSSWKNAHTFFLRYVASDPALGFPQENLIGLPMKQAELRTASSASLTLRIL